MVSRERCIQSFNPFTQIVMSHKQFLDKVDRQISAQGNLIFFYKRQHAPVASKSLMGRLNSVILYVGNRLFPSWGECEAAINATQNALDEIGQATLEEVRNDPQRGILRLYELERLAANMELHHDAIDAHNVSSRVCRWGKPIIKNSSVLDELNGLINNLQQLVQFGKEVEVDLRGIDDIEIYLVEEYGKWYDFYRNGSEAFQEVMKERFEAYNDKIGRAYLRKRYYTLKSQGFCPPALFTEVMRYFLLSDEQKREMGNYARDIVLEAIEEEIQCEGLCLNNAPKMREFVDKLFVRSFLSKIWSYCDDDQVWKNVPLAMDSLVSLLQVEREMSQLFLMAKKQLKMEVQDSEERGELISFFNSRFMTNAASSDRLRATFLTLSNEKRSGVNLDKLSLPEGYKNFCIRDLKEKYRVYRSLIEGEKEERMRRVKKALQKPTFRFSQGASGDHEIFGDGCCYGITASIICSMEGSEYRDLRSYRDALLPNYYQQQKPRPCPKKKVVSSTSARCQYLGQEPTPSQRAVILRERLGMSFDTVISASSRFFQSASAIENFLGKNGFRIPPGVLKAFRLGEEELLQHSLVLHHPKATELRSSRLRFFDTIGQMVDAIDANRRKLLQSKGFCILSFFSAERDGHAILLEINHEVKVYAFLDPNLGYVRFGSLTDLKEGVHQLVEWMYVDFFIFYAKTIFSSNGESGTFSRFSSMLSAMRKAQGG